MDNSFGKKICKLSRLFIENRKQKSKSGEEWERYPPRRIIKKNVKNNKTFIKPSLRGYHTQLNWEDVGERASVKGSLLARLPTSS